MRDYHVSFMTEERIAKIAKEWREFSDIKDWGWSRLGVLPFVFVG
jgi:hypothetical protein